MTDTTAQLQQEQNAILQAALDLQAARLAEAQADGGRIDDLLNTLATQNAELLSVLRMLREDMQHDP